jgi:hypothetical protein
MPTRKIDAEILEKAEKIYAAYPRKVARGAAITAIAKALEKIDFAALLQAVEEYAAARFGQQTCFTPHCATWMNQERWLDERDDWYETTRGREQERQDRNFGAIGRFLGRDSKPKGFRPGDGDPHRIEADYRADRRTD